jgi:hypothetical protein
MATTLPLMYVMSRLEVMQRPSQARQAAGMGATLRGAVWDPGSRQVENRTRAVDAAPAAHAAVNVKLDTPGGLSVVPDEAGKAEDLSIVGRARARGHVRLLGGRATASAPATAVAWFSN